jgi:AcrR family transcriptional regulator
MHDRAASVERTRQRIVAAAIRLFAERTAAATNMEDIAVAAGVSAATVYRHFGDFDSLADACARTAFDIAAVPTPEVAAARFADSPDLATKLQRFIEISCHCYRNAADWLATERRESHLPAFARTLAREHALLDAIVRGLLEPARVDPLTIATVKTLVDFPFWHSLVSNGVPHARVAAVMHHLAIAQLTAAGVTAGDDPKGVSDVSSRARRARAATRSR